MVSTMFLRDWRRMEAEGLKPTVADAIRLNALAIRAKRVARPFVSAHLPRVVFLDGYVIREPTIAHELWIDRVREYVNLDDNLNFRAVYAFALSHPADRLPDPNRHRWTVWRIFSFARRHVFKLTKDALADAIDYALFGADWTVGEFAPERRDDAEPRDATSPTVGVLVRAAARRLPITLDEAKRMTPSRLEEIVKGAELEDFPGIGDLVKNDALGDYFRARDEVRNRLMAAIGVQS